MFSSTSILTGGRSACILAVWAILDGVNGQHTEATCSAPGSEWSYNSLDQNPCTIAEYMASPCSTTGNYTIPPTGPGFHYNPSQIPSICECSTVVYNLYSACAACQGATIGPWDLFSENCSDTARWPDGKYLLDIPFATALPPWAYQQVMGTNRFNVTEAQSVLVEDSHASENKSTASAAPSVPNPSLVPSGGGGGGSQVTVTAAPTNTGNNGASMPIGTIVGAVVGSIAGAALIVGLTTFFLIRRNKSPRRGGYTGVSENGDTNHPESNHDIVGHNGITASISAAALQCSPAARPVSQESSSGQPHTTMYHWHSVDPVKPYDPEGPCTFPLISEGPGAIEPAKSIWSSGEPTLIGLNQPLGAKWHYQDNHREPIAEV